MRRCKKTKFRISKAKNCRKYFGQQQILERGKKTTSKAIANCIDEAKGAEEISNVFYVKYRMLYNSVPTDAHELDDLHNTISNDVVHTNNV